MFLSYSLNEICNSLHNILTVYQIYQSKADGLHWYDFSVIMNISSTYVLHL